MKLYKPWIQFGCCDGEVAKIHGNLWTTLKSAKKELLKMEMGFSDISRMRHDCTILSSGVSIVKVKK